jgi:ribosome-associated toxin RatA of RatAB toxin-antitoxin module
MKHVSRSAIVECSAETFYALVDDIESYPSFLPWCAAAKVREREPGRSIATLTLAAKGIRQSLTTENTHVPGRSIEMRLLEGPFRYFSAAWQFTSLQPGATKVEFTLAYEFSNRIIAAAFSPILNDVAGRTVDAFQRQVGTRANE